MRRTIVGATMLLVSAAWNAPASAQRIAVDLAWYGNGVSRRAAAYPSPAAYMRVSPRRLCAPEGRYLYCWDQRSYRPGRPLTVHVFHQQPRSAVRYGRHGNRRFRDHRPRGRGLYRFHERAALVAWQRWYNAYRRTSGPVYRAQRGHRAVRAPRMAMRLVFHLW